MKHTPNSMSTKAAGTPASIRRASSSRHAMRGSNPATADADADDVELAQADQRPKGRRQQHSRAVPGHDSSESDGSGSMSEEEEQSASEDDDDPVVTTTAAAAAARSRSHAAAAPGPSSTAAAKAAKAGSSKQKAAAGSKKRTAAVAFEDAISLLPADLDIQTLVRIRQQLQPRNRMQKQALLHSYRQEYQHWRFLLRQRFSLLFYGLGSKRSLLEAFAEEALTDGGVLVCDGLAPGINAKQVLQAVAGALTHRSCKSHSHSELLSLIVSEPPCRQLYVLLHNIDGPGLRAGEEQLWLSRLSQAPAVRLVASVDHVNAALLWNSRVAAAFNWLWVDGTTYAGYDAETAHVAPIITSCKQSATKRGATTVLASLVSNAREVFKVLAAQQLQDPSAAGVSFPVLLRIVRERYILSNEHGLKSVLAEFRDHELIKFRPGPDGSEVLYVPMETEMLRGALEEMRAADEAAAA